MLVTNVFATNANQCVCDFSLIWHLTA